MMFAALLMRRNSRPFLFFIFTSLDMLLPYIIVYLGVKWKGMHDPLSCAHSHLE
jgi:hypothetical protein